MRLSAEALGELALGGQAGVERDAPVEHEQADAVGERLVGGNGLPTRQSPRSASRVRAVS